MNLKIKKTIKIAIIGSGRMGQRHAEAYKKNKNVEIVGFNDSIRKNASRLAKKFKTKALTIDEILLDNYKVDVTQYLRLFLDVLKQIGHHLCHTINIF